MVEGQANLRSITDNLRSAWTQSAASEPYITLLHSVRALEMGAIIYRPAEIIAAIPAKMRLCNQFHRMHYLRASKLN